MSVRPNKRPYFWLVTSLLFFIFLYLIRSILLPFIVGIFIAYFLHPAVDKLEKSGTGRGMATLVVIASFFLVILSISVLIIPVIAHQFSGLLAAMPDYLAALDRNYAPVLSHWVGEFAPGSMDGLKAGVADFSGVALRVAGGFATGLFQSGMAFMQLLSLILITPVVAFYLLRDWRIIVRRMDSLLPREHARVIRQQLAIIDRTLAGFVRGQLNVCLIMASWYAIGLSLAGLKFGIVIGLGTGLLVIFPYVGLLLGMTVGLCIAFFQFDSAGQVMAVLAVFLIGSAVESSLITPRLVGEKVSLHPVWIIFGMLAGAALFGFVGILLAVPATAVIGVLIRFATGRYLASEYYTGK